VAIDLSVSFRYVFPYDLMESAGRISGCAAIIAHFPDESQPCNTRSSQVRQPRRPPVITGAG